MSYGGLPCLPWAISPPVHVTCANLICPSRSNLNHSTSFIFLQKPAQTSHLPLPAVSIWATYGFFHQLLGHSGYAGLSLSRWSSLVPTSRLSHLGLLLGGCLGLLFLWRIDWSGADSTSAGNQAYQGTSVSCMTLYVCIYLGLRAV